MQKILIGALAVLLIGGGCQKTEEEATATPTNTATVQETTPSPTDTSTTSTPEPTTPSEMPSPTTPSTPNTQTTTTTTTTTPPVTEASPTSTSTTNTTTTSTPSPAPTTTSASACGSTTIAITGSTDVLFTGGKMHPKQGEISSNVGGMSCPAGSCIVMTPKPWGSTTAASDLIFSFTTGAVSDLSFEICDASAAMEIHGYDRLSAGVDQVSTVPATGESSCGTRSVHFDHPANLVTVYGNDADTDHTWGMDKITIGWACAQ